MSVSRIFILLAYLIISFRLKISFLGVFTASEVSSLSVKTQPRGLDGANVYWGFLGHKEPLKAFTSVIIVLFSFIILKIILLIIPYYFTIYLISQFLFFYLTH